MIKDGKIELKVRANNLAGTSRSLRIPCCAMHHNDGGTQFERYIEFEAFLNDAILMF